MRSGEFTSSQANGGDPVSIGDVSMDPHSDLSIVRLLLRKGKTDPYGNGVFIYILRQDSVCCVSSGFLAPVPDHPSLLQWPAVHLARWLPIDPAAVHPRSENDVTVGWFMFILLCRP